MAQWLEAALFSLEEVGIRVQIPPWQLPFFFLTRLLLQCNFNQELSVRQKKMHRRGDMKRLLLETAQNTTSQLV